jgi:hypothetical protein
MNESKIDATDRLRREGRWGEASKFKDETIKKLRKEGMKQQEARDGAWKAMQDKYPPSNTEMVEESLLASDELWSDMANMSSSTFIDDSMWVYSRLDVAGVEPQDAPSAGAWALLQWARANKDKFFERILPRSLQLSEKFMVQSQMVAEEDEAVANLEKVMEAALSGQDDEGS